MLDSKIQIYLCSRVALDARAENMQVATILRNAGFEVYVPHEQAPNNLSQEDIDQGRYDRETIFKLDFAAMRKADICVVVGRTGRDCAWEMGWFSAKGVPLFFAPLGDTTFETCPMLLPGLTTSPPVKNGLRYIDSHVRMGVHNKYVQQAVQALMAKPLRKPLRELSDRLRKFGT